MKSTLCFFYPESFRSVVGADLKEKMAETIEEKLKNYRTAPFDARFPNPNQTRNCYQNYLGEDDRDL